MRAEIMIVPVAETNTPRPATTSLVEVRSSLLPGPCPCPDFSLNKQPIQAGSAVASLSSASAKLVQSCILPVDRMAATLLPHSKPLSSRTQRSKQFVSFSSCRARCLLRPRADMPIRSGNVRARSVCRDTHHCLNLQCTLCHSPSSNLSLIASSKGKCF